MDTRSLLLRFIGNDYHLVTNVLFIDFAGSHEGGIFLQQLIYWQGKVGKGKYFAKSYDMWFNELRIKKFSLMALKAKFEEFGILATDVRKFNGTPMVHWLIDLDATFTELEKYVNSMENELSIVENATLESIKNKQSKVEKTNNPYTYNTAYNTNIEEEEKTQKKPKIEKAKRAVKGKEKDPPELVKPLYQLQNELKTPEGITRIKEHAKQHALNTLPEQLSRVYHKTYSKQQISEWADIELLNMPINFDKIEFNTNGEIMFTDLGGHLVHKAMYQQKNGGLRIPAPKHQPLQRENSIFD